MIADLILRGGRFTTLDRSNPTATAVAITDGRFTAVGRDEEVMPLAAASTQISPLSPARTGRSASSRMCTVYVGKGRLMVIGRSGSSSPQVAVTVVSVGP